MSSDVLMMMLQIHGKYELIIKYNLMSHQGRSECTITQVIGTKSSNGEKGCSLYTVFGPTKADEGSFFKGLLTQ